MKVIDGIENNHFDGTIYLKREHINNLDIEEKTKFCCFLINIKPMSCCDDQILSLLILPHLNEFLVQYKTLKAEGFINPERYSDFEYWEQISLAHSPSDISEIIKAANQSIH